LQGTKLFNIIHHIKKVNHLYKNVIQRYEIKKSSLMMLKSKLNHIISKDWKFLFSSGNIFMFSMLIVNAGNYAYNLLLGRFLGPSSYSDAAILITFLLVLSFIGMTFQIVTTKYVIEIESHYKTKFIKLISLLSIIIGLIIGIIIFFNSKFLQYFLNTTNNLIFKIFALGIPIYFLLSVNRGIHQGENNMKMLSISYILEMISRFLVTFLMLFFINSIETSIIISIGILTSFIFALFPISKEYFKHNFIDTNINLKPILLFFTLTAFYEFSLIIINNCDIILVKKYFKNHQSGLYASLALIGRVVYFVTWIFVMIQIPKVIQMQKDGIETTKVLFKNILFISFFSSIIIIFTYLFPKFVIFLMFGNDYLEIAPLLWKYAFATALFAIANVFSYYFLSLNNYFPVVLTSLFGFIQIYFITLYHKTLGEVVHVQIFAMFNLLILQILYYLNFQRIKNRRLLHCN
jgi:O-antigen/teichoic acid export membrane protein